MAFIRKIKRGNRVYLAEVESYRDGAQVKQRLIRYIGLDPECASGDVLFKIRDLTVDRVKIYGPVIALESIARELGLFQILGDIAQPILALVFGHCLNFRSLSETETWYKTTDLPAIMGGPEITEKGMRNAIEALSKLNGDYIQRSIFEKMQELFGADLSGVVYDVTNTHLAGSRSNLAQKGKPKDGARNKKIVQIGLGVTRELGIPIFHHTREGNIHDVKLFSEAIDQFSDMNINKGLMVFDRGMTSKYTISTLSKRGWKSLAGVPYHDGIKNIISKMDLSGLRKFRNLVVQGNTEFFVVPIKHRIGKVDGRLLILLNSAKKQRVGQLRRRRIYAARDHLDSGLPLESPDLEKYFNHKWGVDWHAIAREEKFDGLSFLFTDSRLSMREAVRIYFAKDLIEQCFRVEKSVLKLRPFRFWLDSRIKAKVLICHLALSLLTTCRIRLQEKGITEQIDSILRKLSSIYQVYFFIENEKTSNKQSDKTRFNKTNTLSDYQERILKIISPTLKL